MSNNNNNINNYLANIINYTITSNDKIIFEKCSYATILFYTLKNSIQLVSGKIGINSSKSLPLVVTYGLVTTIGSICITHSSIPHLISISNKLFYHNNESELSYYNQISNSIYHKIYSDDKHITQKGYIKHIGVSIGFFTLLERNYFKTSIPSSVITIGVHAKHKGSVIATSEVATDRQRKNIQLLGKKYGCHHCSSKQLLSKKRFIADHMPPTKIAKEMNLEWWRKYFNITVCYIYLIIIYLLLFIIELNN
jgi:hypothetical protein